jgi:hypothetical protein
MPGNKSGPPANPSQKTKWALGSKVDERELSGGSAQRWARATARLDIRLTQARLFI